MPFTVKRAIALLVVAVLVTAGVISFFADWHTTSSTPAVLAAAALVAAVSFDLVGWTRRGRARIGRKNT